MAKKLLASLVHAQEKLELAYESYHHGKRLHEDRQSTFLEELAQTRAQVLRTTTEQHLRNVMYHENIRLSFHSIKYALSTLNLSGVITVKEPQQDGTTIEYTDKEDVERACMRENERKDRKGLKLRKGNKGKER